jgi:hypothetical protein
MLKRTNLIAQLTLCALLVTFAARLAAQNGGDNAISSDALGTIAASTAYIDASPYYWALSTLDICAAINQVLTSTNYPPNGAVVDARGILVGYGANPPLECATNPFSGVTKPSTILLPAISIQISVPWQLPGNTRVVGEGPGVTTLEIPAGSVFPVNHAMIEMCPTSACTGVSIEHLKVAAQPVQGTATSQIPADGIDNCGAGDGSYVDDVYISGVGAITSTGAITNPCSGTVGTVNSLYIGPGAAYSGPYTNIDAPSSALCSGLTCLSTACVKIQAQTRGVHGITCTAVSNNSTYPQAAIYLDAYGNTIEDVHVEGFYDGVVVGDNADAENVAHVSGNRLSNIVGAFGSGFLQNTIHICKGGLASHACAGTTGEAVDNLVILQALSKGSPTNVPGANFASTILDDTSGQPAINLSGNPAWVGLYVLGGQVTGGGSFLGYSRFTTAPGPYTTTNNTNTTLSPTWGVGGALSVNNQNEITCSNPGAIYSNPGGSSGSLNTIYVCSGGHWVGIGN